MPYCFLGSSITFQGHTGWKIDDLNPIWVRLLGWSQLSNPSDLPCFCRYLYFGEIVKIDTAVPTLYAAKKYMMPHLAELCVEHLQEEVEPSNACLLLSHSHLFDETKLAQRCWYVIDTQTEDVFQSDDFTDIDHKTLQEILVRETLDVDETKVFDAAKRWAEAECLRQGRDPSPQQCREMLGEALYLLRFPTMTLGDFADGAGQSGLLSVQETNDLFFNFSAKKKPKLRFPTTPRKGRPLYWLCWTIRTLNCTGNQWSLL